MPRIRSVKPEFFTSEPVNACSIHAQHFFIALWCWCDDEGRAVENARALRGFAYSMRDDVTLDDIERWLCELAAVRLIIRYEHGGRRYLAVRNFKEHQHPKKPTPSKLPPPPTDIEKCVSTQLPTGSPPVPPEFPTGSPPVPPGEERSSRGVGEERIPSAAQLVPHDAVQPVPIGSTRSKNHAMLPANDAPFTLDVEDLAESVVAGSPKPRRAAANTAKSKTRDEPKYPHFRAETRKALLKIWEYEVRPLKHGEPGRLFATFGPFFREPEAERAPSAPRDAEVIAAVQEILQARSHGGRATAQLAVPEYCAERVRPVVEILRECPSGLDRVERIDRCLGIARRIVGRP